jgi:ribosomal protein S18 acetylase RimI-like enzyme
VKTPGLRDSIAARDVIARAFVDDPLLRWIFPDPLTRLECTAAWMGLFVEEYLLHARVDTITVDGCVGGVALWRIPGNSTLPHPEQPSIPGLLGALVGVDHQQAVGLALRAFSLARPSTPFAYLQFLAIAPEHQGRGLGRRLIDDGCNAAASAGLPVYLETTNPRNLSFYFSLGFAVVNQFTLDHAGPDAWCLARSAPNNDAAPSP